MTKCPFGKCEKCVWYREWRYDNDMTGEHKLEKKCSLEVLLDYIPKIEGAIRGVQGGVEQARNRSAETKDIINRFVHAQIEIASRHGYKSLPALIKSEDKDGVE